MKFHRDTVLFMNIVRRNICMATYVRNTTNQTSVQIKRGVLIDILVDADPQRD